MDFLKPFIKKLKEKGDFRIYNEKGKISGEGLLFEDTGKFSSGEKPLRIYQLL